MNERTREQQRLEEVERTVEAMRSGQDIENIENMKRRALFGVIEAGSVSASTDILQAVDEDGSATYDVAKEPDNKVRVTIDGTDYYIGLYLA